MSTPNTDPSDRRPPVTERVTAALEALNDEFVAVAAERPDTATGHSDRAYRLAFICARRAGWWRLLLARPHRREISLLFARAVFHTAAAQQSQARFWRDAAADWSARAERRPTSDAAGAMSNHHDLGIAS
ncbi:MAG: hypothetical protein J0I34_12605 [Pseudonocardia sp.]|uniref:hypothetical protein n=1 Tax=unclassified Pseudonocardia TaxID=2619320 RepID=UPI00086BCA29|nr:MULTISPECIES: hypothetical protein [unclassified Pseudonocardia]MBN9109615.1 hypothetical protein [Pseudonocardia sp.]ODU24658.1 MAG: hypothetical protein ABS80_11825 [Pseudonocardia sp. SCN 72-51]ODU99080.1 MAG: hypothetical protein ABT15_32490 [Pseudonocardia sp. SCN 73-27]